MDVEFEEVSVEDVLLRIQEVVRLAAYLLHYLTEAPHYRLQTLYVRVLRRQQIQIRNTM